MDPLEPRKEGDPRAAIRKALIETSSIRDVFAVLRAKNVEGREARTAERIIEHAPILGSSRSPINDR